MSDLHKNTPPTSVSYLHTPVSASSTAPSSLAGSGTPAVPSSGSVSHEAVAAADAAVVGYLVFRGFLRTARQFDTEKRSDKLCSYQPERIASDLLSLATTPDMPGLLKLWKFVDEHIFSKGNGLPRSTIDQVGNSLKKLCLVSAVQASQMDSVKKFLEAHADELSGSNEWIPWFSLPFVRHPNSASGLEMYFTREWSDSLAATLRNLLITSVNGLAKPQLLALPAQALERRQLLAEVSALESELAAAKEMLAESLSAATAANSSSAGSAGFPRPTLLSGADTRSTPDVDGVDDAVVSRVRSNSLIVDSAESWTDDCGVAVTATRSFNGHTSTVTRCRFSPEGNNFASASRDNTLRVWSMDAARNARNATLFCAAPVAALDWEPHSGKLLLFGTADGRVKLWNVDLKRMSLDARSQKESQSPSSGVVDVAMAPGGNMFVVAAGSPGFSSLSSSSLCCWDTRSGQPTQFLAVEPEMTCIRSLRFNHNGTMLLAGGEDGMVRVFDTTKDMSALMGWPAHEGAVTSVQFAPDETSILSAGTDGRVVEWSLRSMGRCMNEWVVTDFSSTEQHTPVEVAVSSDSFESSGRSSGGQGRSSIVGHWFTTSSKTQRLPFHYVWREERSSNDVFIRAHEDAITAVDWHPLKPVVLSGSIGGSIRLTTLKLAEPGQAASDELTV